MLTVSNVAAYSATLILSNHGSTWYYKYTSPSGGECSSAQTGRTANLTNINQNTTYTYAAYSDSGCATLLDAASSFLTKPGKVKWDSLTPIEAWDQYVIVDWIKLGNITEYKVQWRCGTEDWDDERSSTVTTTSRDVIQNLPSGVECHFRIAGKNASGYGEWSDVRSATPKGTTLVASNVESTTLTLTISTLLQSTWHFRHITPTIGTCHSNSGNNNKSANVQGLEAGTNYKFQSYARVGCPSLHISATSATILTKAAKVTGLSVNPLDTRLALSWTAQKSATSYKIQWKSGTEDWDATNRQTTSTSTSKTLTTLTNATQYSIRGGGC